jgi:hypothetical protein
MAVGQTTINNQLIVAVAKCDVNNDDKSGNADNENKATASTLAAATGHWRGQRSGRGSGSSNVGSGAVAAAARQQRRRGGGAVGGEAAARRLRQNCFSATQWRQRWQRQH